MRILIFGDSIARGSFDTECGGWANRLSAVFSQKTLDIDEYCNTYNLGIAGESSAGLLGRIESEIKSRIELGSGEIITLVLTGTNDSKVDVKAAKNLTDISEYRENYEQIISLAKKYSDKVFCIGLTRVDESKTNPIAPNNKIAFRNEELKKYESVISEVATDAGVSIINVSDSFGVPDLSPDGIHPNSRGHQLIFERVKEALEKENIL